MSVSFPSHISSLFQALFVPSVSQQFSRATITKMASLAALIDAYVNPDKSAAEQDVCRKHIFSFLLEGDLTIQSIVKDMEMYLTTTDNAIRARGILLLAEILSFFQSKPLESTAIKSLATFFTSRLADWPSLHGALLGCLALLKRRTEIGKVTSEDVTKLARSYVENISVQALVQNDRMLCFELLECLLDCYTDAVLSLGEDLICGVCAAIDEEKDPCCLLSVFRIVGLVMKNLPSENSAADLFDIISRYFPISFRPPENDKLQITSEDLSNALLEAFMSSPLFAPHTIPLFLEKLSSSLVTAKIESLKYLGKCSKSYGGDAISNQADAIWTSLKNEFWSDKKPVVNVNVTENNELYQAALTCLTDCAFAFQKEKEPGVLLQLLLDDKQLDNVFKSVIIKTEAETLSIDNTVEPEAKVFGSFLYAAAISTPVSCFSVCKRFLPPLLDLLVIFYNQNCPVQCTKDVQIRSKKMTADVIYIFNQMILSNKLVVELTVSQPGGSSEVISSCSSVLLLKDHIRALISIFKGSVKLILLNSCETLAVDKEDGLLHLGVMSLQLLATFPKSLSPVSKEYYMEILTFFRNMILENVENSLFVEEAVKALSEIGSNIESVDSEKTAIFIDVVIRELFDKLISEEYHLLRSVILKAITSICNKNNAALSQAFQSFRFIVINNLKQVNIEREQNRAFELVTTILECFSSVVLPRSKEVGIDEDNVMGFLFDIWSSLKGNLLKMNCPPKKFLEASMTTMRVAVQHCSEAVQENILLRALEVCSFTHSATETNGFRSSDIPDNKEWWLALLASVIVALKPQIVLHNNKKTISMFLDVISRKGDTIVKTAAAQALGSMINKYPTSLDHTKVCDIHFEQAINLILNDGLLKIINRNLLTDPTTPIGDNKISRKSNDIEECSIELQSVSAVSWIGKGLAMRGHEKISEIAMVLLGLMQTCSSSFSRYGSCKDDNNQMIEKRYSVSKAAAEGFRIIMRDSENCLNRGCHACIRPLFKQRFFTSMASVLILAIRNSLPSSPSRLLLYCALAHLISEAPHVALMVECEKVLPFIIEGISSCRDDPLNKDILLSFLLAFSMIIMDDDKGKAVVLNNLSSSISCLVAVISYPHSMMVRETALRCLGAMVAFPYASLFPLRKQVLTATTKTKDDSKRSVRKEAVRCYNAWVAIASK